MSDGGEYVAFDPAAKRQADKTRYPGKELDILYDRRRCMHAAECGRASKRVFDGSRSPWIEPDHVAADDLVRIVQRCPTGALRVVRDGEEVPDPVPATNSITSSPDGPLFVRGDLRVHLPDGTVVTETRIALCRCGASANKPYCDNSHVKAGFRDAGGVGRDPEQDETGTGALEIKLSQTGPILIKGPFELRAASGRVALRADKCALCRCGASGFKPICDGSHNRIGFKP